MLEAARGSLTRVMSAERPQTVCVLARKQERKRVVVVRRLAGAAAGAVEQAALNRGTGTVVCVR